MEQVTRICPRCGAPRPEDAKECPVCGVVFARVLASREANLPRPPATTPPTPRIRAAGRAQNVFRQGKLLVVQIGHALPPRCVSCNRPAQTLLYKNSTYRPWTGWLFVVLVGLLSGGRVRRLGGGFRAEFEVPLCARHESKRKLSNVILGSLLALFFLALLGGNFLADKYPKLDPRLTVAPAGVVIVAMLVGLVFSYKPFGLKKIDNQFIWLSRVSPEYLRELREEPAEDPETVWKWLLIGLAFAVVIAGGVWFQQWRSAKREAHGAPKAPVATADADTAPAAPVAQAPPQEAKAPESDGCRPGFIWREARPEDHVCVTPETRQSVAEDNRQAESRHESGLDTCRYGFVWREAFPGDFVCVTPDVRRMTRIDNAQAQERRGAP